MTEKKSYRQMMKELPGEFEILTRFSLLKPARQFSVLSTALAQFMTYFKEDKHAELFDILISAAEKKFTHAIESVAEESSNHD